MAGWKKAALAVGWALVLATAPARAQSEASWRLSALPVASVVGGGVAAAAVLSVAGVLVVKTVEVSARGTVWVLERASDGAQVSVALGAHAASAAALGVGSAVSVSVMASGVLLSAAGAVLCFIPNGLGRELLYDERVTD